MHGTETLKNCNGAVEDKPSGHAFRASLGGGAGEGGRGGAGFCWWHLVGGTLIRDVKA